MDPTNKILCNCVVVVAQLAGQSLLTPEIRGVIPNIGNEVFLMYLSVNCNQVETKNKEKEARLGPFKKILHSKSLSYV